MKNRRMELLAGKLGFSSALYPEPPEHPFQGGPLWLMHCGSPG